MRTCPECLTQYEDHVLTCLVDGVDLTQVPRLAPAGQPALAPTPEPAPVQKVFVVPPQRSASRAMPAVVATLVLLFSVVAGMPVAGWAVWTLTRPTPVPVPAPTVRPVPVVVAPTPTEVPIRIEPAPVPVVQVQVTSDPIGAEVWEGQTRLCVTPCMVDHPEDAPLPRTLTFRLTGRGEVSASLEDPGQPVHVRWKSTPPSPTQPKPRNETAPKIGTQR
jgi:hypothetical protein